MKLIKLEVTSFKGISPNSPIVVDFSKSRFIKAVGDNGVCKTSLLESLLVACGYKSKEDKDFINAESGKVDIDFEFEAKDKKKYRVRVTKSRFVLEYEGESLPEPITKMKELLGVPGVSPMDIKTKELKDIVKWLAAYTSKGTEEFEKKMQKLKDGIKMAKTSRADANRSAKGLREYLSSEPLYLNWENSEKKYAKKVDVKTLSEQLDEVGKKSDKFIQAEAKLKQLTEREESLQAQLKNIQSELSEVQKSINGGKKYIADNAGVKKEYDDIKKQYDAAATEAVAFEKWQDIKRKQKELDGFEDLSQKADAQEKELLEYVKELQAEIIPDVKGVELVLEDEYEDGELIRRAGMYRGGVNAAQMSETEWISTVFEILRKNKTKILVIDNYQSLGSLGVEVINKLHKDGCYVFAAEMNREKKEIEIQYQ